ncbi:MAG: DUF7344 domain-containing protein [Halodesulfurarchaeum sp.]
MIRLHRQVVPETKIHFVLSNPRRQDTLRYLARNAGRATVRELSEFIAAEETGEVPAPRRTRETVYVSLHQTHLPALDELGIIEYDRVNKEIVSLAASRDLRVYMEVVTRFGMTWDEYYRYLGIFGMLVILAGQMGVPPLAAVDPLVFAVVFLFAFAVSTIYQFRHFGTSVPGWLSRVFVDFQRDRY